MEGSRIRFDGVDIGQLRHIQEELARLRDDMDEGSEPYQELDDAIDRIERGIEAGSITSRENSLIDATDFMQKDNSEKGYWP